MPENRTLPAGVQQGTYELRPIAAEDGTSILEIDITGFIGFWPEAKRDIIRAVRSAEPDVIKLFISSLGGFVDDALAIHDFLKTHDARVETTIAGMTASAATIVALSGDHIRISDNALYLVHHASAGLLAFGKAEDIEESADEVVRMLRKVNGRMINIYQKRTGLGEEELNELLDEEEWLTPEEALAYGFVDDIYEPESPEATASADLGSLRAIGLPPVPPNSTKTANTMPGKAKNTPETPSQEEAKSTAPENSAAAENKAGDQPDERDHVAKMEARLKQLEAENQKMAADRKAAAIEALKSRWTGKVPGAAVDQIAKLAEEQDADVIQKIAAIAEAVPQMVEAGRVPVPEVDKETSETRTKAVQKF